MSRSAKPVELEAINLRRSALAPVPGFQYQNRNWLGYWTLVQYGLTRNYSAAGDCECVCPIQPFERSRFRRLPALGWLLFEPCTSVQFMSQTQSNHQRNRGRGNSPSTRKRYKNRGLPISTG